MSPRQADDSPDTPPDASTRDGQIGIRRQRARDGKFAFQNTGRNRVFSTFAVTNTANGNTYEVRFRSFAEGENACTCPDFRTNTLRTCKHIEALQAHLEADAPPHLRQRRAAPRGPELTLDYGERLAPALLLPERHSDRLALIASRYFDADGRLRPDADLAELRRALENVPERIDIRPEADEWLDRQIEDGKFRIREGELWVAYCEGHWQPDLLKVPLYDYQVKGALFLACRGRCILADDMGLGKTAQTLAAAELMARERRVRRVLVIAPASVKFQWEAEIRRFTDRPMQVIDGRSHRREEQYRQDTFYRLVNYEQVERDADLIRGWSPDLIVLDEAQRIKNWESETSRAVKRLRSRFAVALTGTPLENRLEELYSIVAFIDDRLLGPPFRFLSEHRVTDAEGRVTGYRHLDRIRERLRPILLRRAREEVLTQLPPRTETVIPVELTPIQRSLYDVERQALARALARPALGEADRRRVLGALTTMRLVCDSSALVDPATADSPKLEELEELLTESPGKAVVFTQWDGMARLAAALLERLGVGYVYLHGKVPAADRPALMARFRDDPAVTVFLSTDAGGVGLNLQAARTVINLEVPWNPAVLQQRAARVHRMGQEHPVRVVHLVARDTVEERVLDLVARKQALLDGLFDDEAGDAVALELAGRPAFLAGLRELLADPAPPPPAVAESSPEMASAAVLEAAVALMEATAALVRACPGLPAEARERARRAAGALARALG